MPSNIQMPQTPTSEGLRTGQMDWMPPVPIIKEDQPLSDIVRELSQIVKSLFSNVEHDDRGVFQTRGFACEIVAWRFLTHLSEHELIDYLLTELPPIVPVSNHSTETEEATDRPTSTRIASSSPVHERARLLFEDRTTSIRQPRVHEPPRQGPSKTWNSRMSDSVDDEPIISFAGLNALEIATIAGAKRFLSQYVVQQVIDGIWGGDIIFWESLSVHTRKRAQIYHQRKADPYCRLRVPRYQKAFEAAFFAIFLILYYAVLGERNPQRITLVEVLLYIWIAAFACDELGEFTDAGSLMYADFWNLWDVGIIGIGTAYLILRIVGLAKQSAHIIEISFDILSLEALFLVPRVCSLLSLHPYFGTLIPCLKEMTKDFVKFLGIVIILFFGSSYLGFDIASKISPALGPTLMLLFIILTNILLLTSLIAILSQSLTKVMDHAREEYLFQYSVFVLEASASRRLTSHALSMGKSALSQQRNQGERMQDAKQQRAASGASVAFFPWGPFKSWVHNADRMGPEPDTPDSLPAAEALRAGGSTSKCPDHTAKGHSYIAPKYLAVRKRSEASLMAKVPGSGSHNQFARDSDVLADMKKILDKLNTQEEMIEKLSRQLDGLPVPHPPSPKA
ncbi:MAG: hypothetical protein Q9178_001957 [Gyalolechia marmorata]